MAPPEKLGNILAQLLTARGYGRVGAGERLAEAWQKAAGEAIAKLSAPGALKRGTLEVTVTSSMLMQELGFQKEQLLASLQKLLPDEKITKLKFRVGKVT
jgi:predicted nucleic acid-binding Zn ribbon protein